ncbi:YqaJ viral recombinase family protein [Candidatus Pacearchaeota archaeon]|nr:YqaJ viral recombinase family protein [Candidatus Pacearchaeota archaeon]
MRSEAIYIEDAEQGSKDWYALRAGLPSASCFDKLITSKGAPSKSAQKYLYQLAGERLLGYSPPSYQNNDMVRGQEVEAEARASYEFITDAEVKQVGFCFKDERRLYGCSPDGLIGDDGGLEIKCPILSTAAEYLDKGKLPTTYVQQVQGSMLITGRAWWDFMSYYPGLRPLIVRVERNENLIAALEVTLEVFCVELDELTERLRG